MPIDPEQIERVYSNYAVVYDRVFGRVFQASREAVVRNLKIDPGERVLEVGVGTGLCLPMYPAHCDVTAIDLSQPMLEKAAARVKEHQLTNVKLQRMDAGNMTFAENSFDLVIAAYVVTAVPDYRKLMSEMVRVSRPGGRLVLLNHFTQDSPIIAAVEKAISPICIKMGFRTDLSVDEVIDGWPLIKERDERVKPLGMWHVVECLNNKGLNHGGHKGHEGKQER
ncbi:MAG: pmtA [Betaproteobacteria bacterium]|jgi:phosphatidylethanolamine/phosphatidyl-N-methylethanolamine N-methyltransferase|nr:pmtA [Betaproteobacteria bacterium]MEA3156813.1 phosphatidylethanolamine/phosphatidyl-N-methylethanolamine N-methyltransferase [Betaproteobacteria bacterium]